MSIHHFTSHLDQVITYYGDGSYTAKRLVQFTWGASGYTHGAVLTMPPGTKALTHWHPDRESIYYCIGGSGIFWLDTVERQVGVGDAMFIPLMSAHCAVNTGPEPLVFLDYALFSDIRSSIDPGACFSNIETVPAVETAFGQDRPLFPQSTYGNPAIRWVGELWVEPGRALTERDVEPGTEQILQVLEGEGALDLLGQRLALSPGSVQYLIDGLPFRIGNTGRSRLRLLGTRSRPGRIPEPPLFEQVRRRTGALA